MHSTLLNPPVFYVYIGTVYPIFMPVAVPVTFVYNGLQRFYNCTSIELTWSLKVYFAFLSGVLKGEVRCS